MNDEELKELTARIRQELDEIRRVLPRINEGWERARRLNDDYYIDSVALNFSDLRVLQELGGLGCPRRDSLA